MLLDQLAAILARAPAVVVLAAPLVALVLAAVSRRVTTVLGTLWLLIIAVLVVAESVPGAAPIALGLYLASLTMAISGIAARRANRTLEAKLADLRLELSHVITVQSRHFVIELNKPSKQAAQARAPSEEPGVKGPRSDPQ